MHDNGVKCNGERHFCTFEKSNWSDACGSVPRLLTTTMKFAWVSKVIGHQVMSNSASILVK